MFQHITGGSPGDAIHAFIPDTESWLHVADLPRPLCSASSLVLPSGDLVVVKNEESRSSITVLKASLKGKCHTLSGESVPKYAKLQITFSCYSSCFFTFYVVPNVQEHFNLLVAWIF